MRGKTAAALCAACLAAGVAAGFLAGRGRPDEELRAAQAEKESLLAELGQAVGSVRESSGSLEAINRKMAAASGEAEKAAAAMADKAASIETLVGSLRSCAKDARLKLRELSGELGAAVGENRARVEGLDGILKRAGGTKGSR